MNKRILALLAIIMLCMGAEHATARKKIKMKLHEQAREEQKVKIVVNSSKDLFIGNKIYVLYVGNRHFDQADEDLSNPEKHRIVFYVPVSDYERLNDGARMFISYGWMNPEDTKENTMRDLCKRNNRKCWSVGKFNKRKSLMSYASR
jgi:hypothetical protein